MDAFVDLFITLCILVNTTFMALDHDNMGPQLEQTLKYGNYVRGCFGCFGCFGGFEVFWGFLGVLGVLRGFGGVGVFWVFWEI